MAKQVAAATENPRVRNRDFIICLALPIDEMVSQGFRFAAWPNWIVHPAVSVGATSFVVSKVQSLNGVRMRTCWQAWEARRFSYPNPGGWKILPVKDSALGR
jgi:hypothetical protein